MERHSEDDYTLWYCGQHYGTIDTLMQKRYGAVMGQGASASWSGMLKKILDLRIRSLQVEIKPIAALECSQEEADTLECVLISLMLGNCNISPGGTRPSLCMTAPIPASILSASKKCKDWAIDRVNSKAKLQCPALKANEAEAPWISGKLLIVGAELPTTDLNTGIRIINTKTDIVPLPDPSKVYLKSATCYTELHRLLHDSINVRRPSVIVPMGFDAASMFNAVKLQSSFLHRVGEIQVYNFSQDPEGNDENSFSLVVPVVHPGFMRYSGFTVAMRHLSFAAFSVVSIVLQIVDLLEASRRYPSRGAEWAHYVKDVAEEMLRRSSLAESLSEI
ncbi:hypothetical protein EC973_001754 [Apophysomyces ossiformis]|uniref:Uncharacterized protein n=1 Tax=Apophysomyces ossiformis TaxID=679940 RepID=A0A8H7EN07_9FUNG|nr:hypothetical protein EC973_001754 [Apophysomyces ossiformis]